MNVVPYGAVASFAVICRVFWLITRTEVTFVTPLKLVSPGYCNATVYVPAGKVVVVMFVLNVPELPTRVVLVTPLITIPTVSLFAGYNEPPALMMPEIFTLAVP